MWCKTKFPISKRSALLGGALAFYGCSAQDPDNLFTSISGNSPMGGQLASVGGGPASSVGGDTAQGGTGGAPVNTNGMGGTLAALGGALSVTGGMGSGGTEDEDPSGEPDDETGGSDGGSDPMGGTSNATGGAGAAGSGQEPGTPPFAGAAGSMPVAGSGGSTCQPKTEICDGRDQSCSQALNEVCPTNCTGAAFQGRGYMFCSIPLTRNQANQVCVANGQTLAAIDDAQENAWVRGSLSAMNVEVAWLGGRDNAAEGTWLWPDGRQFWQGRATGQAVQGRYANWANMQPNNEDNQDCMVMNDDGGWNDVTCSGEQSGFVCRAD